MKPRKTGPLAPSHFLVAQSLNDSMAQELRSGATPVALTATALENRPGGRGVVLVIEDLSELLSAQRVAAWCEVARRMAHEINHPLITDY